jgi:hypothetical protein
MAQHLISMALLRENKKCLTTLASAQRKRQRLIGREVAEFTGQSGITRGSLGTATGGQY